MEGVDNAGMSNIMIIPSNPLHRLLELSLSLKMLGSVMINRVLVDGFLRTKFRSTDKTKALVEGVDNARVSNIMINP